MFFIKDDSITFTPTAEEKEKFAPIPEGEHVVTILEAQFDQDDNGSFLKVDLAIDDEESKFNKRRIWETAYFDGDGISDKRKLVGQRKVNELLKIVGADGFETQEEANMQAMRMIGQTLSVQTKNREYQGKVYTNVQKFLPLPGDGEPAPAPTSAPSSKSPHAFAKQAPAVRKVTTTKAFR